MLLGAHSLRLDEKFRIFLPVKWRSELNEGVVMMKGQERCVYLWTQAEFERRTTELAQMTVSSKRARDRARSIFPIVHQDAPDKQGRVTLPEWLRQYAGLQRECTVLGLRSRIEIWEPDAWRRYEAELEPTYADLDTEEEVVSGL